MFTLVEKRSNLYDYFLMYFLLFPDLFDKVFLITFKFSSFGFSYTFLQSNVNKTVQCLISFFITQRDYNGYNYHSF